MITADTNVLVRYTMHDDPIQADTAHRAIHSADIVCIPTTALCEYAWVLRSVYRLSRTDIAQALRTIIGAENVRVNEVAVQKGLAMLDLGGDFADGVIAVEGQWLGGEEFVTFDRQAADLLPAVGIRARYLDQG